jgi:hypothetical protein
VHRETELILFPVILVFSLTVRFWKILAIPSSIWNDETMFLFPSWESVTTQAGIATGPGIFGFGWNGFPQLSYMLHSLPNILVGVPNHHALLISRLCSSMLGVAGICILYFFVRRWWGSGIALTAIAVASTSELHLAWSRRGMNNIDMAILLAWPLYALSRALDVGSFWSYVWLGVSAGAGWYGYLGAKITTFVIPLILAFNILSLKNRRFLFASLCAFLMTIAPLIPIIYYNWDAWYAFHVSRVDVLTPVTSIVAGRFDHLAEIFRYRLALLRILFENNSFTQPLVLLGIALAVLMIRDLRYRVLLLWLVFAGYAGIMGTAWHTARIFTIWPLLCVFPAILVQPVAGIKIVRGLVALFITAILIYDGSVAYFVNYGRKDADVTWHVCNASWHGARSVSVVGSDSRLDTSDLLNMKCGIYWPHVMRKAGDRNYEPLSFVPYDENGPYADLILFLNQEEVSIKRNWRVTTIVAENGRMAGFAVDTREPATHGVWSGWMQLLSAGS